MYKENSCLPCIQPITSRICFQLPNPSLHSVHRAMAFLVIDMKSYARRGAVMHCSSSRSIQRLLKDVLSLLPCATSLNVISSRVFSPALSSLFYGFFFKCLYYYLLLYIAHSSQFQGLSSTKSSSKCFKICHILYIYKNPKLLFPFFISCYFTFSPN